MPPGRWLRDPVTGLADATLLEERSGQALKHADRFFIGGEWVAPSSNKVFHVIDCSTEERAATVPEAVTQDMEGAIAAARNAFDKGPWPRMSPAERGDSVKPGVERSGTPGRGRV